jgi:outer membrane protein OmpA-like peptidoglycan-associated protein
LAAAGLAVVLLRRPTEGLAQTALPLPLPQGATVVTTLSFPGGERESFMNVKEVSPKGTRWTWNLVEIRAQGDTVKEELAFVESTDDVADAFRILTFHGKEGPVEHPGYTMMAVSRAVYRRLRATGVDSFQVMELAPPAGSGPAAQLVEGLLGRRRWVPVRWRGTLAVTTPATAPFSLLVNGRRQEVSALHLRGNFAAKGRRFEPEVWVLADSAYPLLLKWIGHSAQPSNVYQTVRVDFPPAGSEVAASGGRQSGDLEGALSSECRVELPGIYFAFNSAVLDPASDRTIGVLAEVLGRHPDWIATIEGHTDSIGTPAANQTLSEQRAAAVRERLVGTHKVDPSRLYSTGYGSGKPRESNATIEGRARNRRVELVRHCRRVRAIPSRVLGMRRPRCRSWGVTPS